MHRDRFLNPDAPAVYWRIDFLLQSFRRTVSAKQGGNGSYFLTEMASLVFPLFYLILSAGHASMISSKLKPFGKTHADVTLVINICRKEPVSFSSCANSALDEHIL